MLQNRRRRKDPMDWTPVASSPPPRLFARSRPSLARVPRPAPPAMVGARPGPKSLFSLSQESSARQPGQPRFRTPQVAPAPGRVPVVPQLHVLPQHTARVITNQPISPTCTDAISRHSDTMPRSTCSNVFIFPPGNTRLTPPAAASARFVAGSCADRTEEARPGTALPTPTAAPARPTPR